jgi:L-ascorbate metabolism protein UlaG (beta-lactamase superfamily)
METPVVAREPVATGPLIPTMISHKEDTMAMLTYHGHAFTALQGGGKQILIDPFITGNPLAKVSPDEVEADYILVTHGHGDHLGDTVAIAARTGALVVSNYEIATYCQNQGANAHPLHLGGGMTLPFGRVKMTVAHHGSSFPDGGYAGNPGGFLIDLEEKHIYHAGDTALFSDMSLIGRGGLDVALLPIGDNFTMGPDDALEAVKLLTPKVVIPMHYGTFEIVEQDPGAFKKMVEAETKTRCVVLEPGGSLEIA